jgi:hypothetical protein
MCRAANQPKDRPLGPAHNKDACSYITIHQSHSHTLQNINYHATMVSTDMRRPLRQDLTRDLGALFDVPRTIRQQVDKQ